MLCYALLCFFFGNVSKVPIRGNVFFEFPPFPPFPPLPTQKIVKNGYCQQLPRYGRGEEFLNLCHVFEQSKEDHPK